MGSIHSGELLQSRVFPRYKVMIMHDSLGMSVVIIFNSNGGHSFNGGYASVPCNAIDTQGMHAWEGIRHSNGR